MTSVNEMAEKARQILAPGILLRADSLIQQCQSPGEVGREEWQKEFQRLVDDCDPTKRDMLKNYVDYHPSRFSNPEKVCIA